MKGLIFLFVLLGVGAGGVVSARHTEADLGPNQQTTVINKPAPDTILLGSTFKTNDDGSYETAMAWVHSGVVAPYYGAWAEGFVATGTNRAVCGAKFALTQIGCEDGWLMDVYVWDAANGNPNNVLYMAPGINPGTIGTWPVITQHNIALPAVYAVPAEYFVGWWGRWPGALNGWYVAIDENGFGDGRPRTNIAPGIGFPTGWNHPNVTSGAGGGCQDLGIGVYEIASVGIPAYSRTITAWGDNTYGECSVPSPNAEFAAIAAGGYHSLGLKSDGTIVAWGNNAHGQCNVPYPSSGFVAVAGGAYHSLGLKSNGTIVAWGENAYGQCNVPSPDSCFLAIAASAYHSLGLKSDGSIVAWGDNTYGQCNVPSPNTGFVAFAGGWVHSLGLKSDGTIVAWGDNSFGQCTVPSPNTGFVAVSGGGSHSLGLKSNGTIVAWGYNNHGQCNIPSPNSGFVAVAGGAYHSLGLKSNGTIVAWGNNQSGQCNVPSPNTDFVAVAGGGAHSLGLAVLELGACCLVAHCDILSESSCGSDGGIYQGDGTLCDPNPCPTSTMDGGASGVVRDLRAIPNPSQGTCRVSFRATASGPVSVQVFDTSGRLLRKLHDGPLPIGEFSLTWDGRDDNGLELTPGVYFAKIQMASRTTTAKITLTR